MRTIIAGSRSCTKYRYVAEAMTNIEWTPTSIISGTAHGADQLGELWAIENNVPIERFPANWVGNGMSAGFIRNEEMANNADALVALWDGKSTGTLHMIELAELFGLDIYIHLCYNWLDPN
jgi:DNA-binding transcriptional regulator PaaX